LAQNATNLKKIVCILLVLILPAALIGAPAESTAADADAGKIITMTPLQVVRTARALIERGDLEHSYDLLSKTPRLSGPLEIERQFLLSQIAQKRGDYKQAIKILRKLLDDRPSLARVRVELGLCYMQTKQWYRADYHLRLAAADDKLPAGVLINIKRFLYIIRQNKNWNIWFNFGIAPDNNINTSAGGEECVMTMFGPMCRQLPEPEKAVGLSLNLGGNYEFKLAKHWRWKNDFAIFSNTYDKSKFNDFYLSAGTGPRYIWKRGDIWTAFMATRRWYGGETYSRQIGGKINFNYDIARKLSGGLHLRYLPTVYDEYGQYLDGESFAVNPRLSYSIDATKYLILRVGLERENTKDETYANWRKTISLGLGAELPLGFNIYLEPSLSWSDYDGTRWVVKDGGFTQVVEKDFLQRYSSSISNANLGFWGFAPSWNFSYTRRTSNIWQREFAKTSLGLEIIKRF
jgi:tetratricopeptide (TPR) repeat protein